MGTKAPVCGFVCIFAFSFWVSSASALQCVYSAPSSNVTANFTAPDCSLGCDWSEATLWKHCANQAPGIGDIAIVNSPGNYTLIYNSHNPLVLTALYLGSGLLNDNGTQTVEIEGAGIIGTVATTNTTIYRNGIFIFDAQDMAGPPIFVAAGGQFIWENGTLQGETTTRLEVKSGGFVSIVSENDKVLSRLLTNSGTVLHQSSRELWVEGGSITNTEFGVFQIAGASSVSAHSGEIFQNDGKISVLAGGATLNISIIGTGKLDVGSDVCTVYDNVTFASIAGSSSGTLSLRTQSFLLTSISDFSGNFNWLTGTIQMTNNAILSLHGTSVFTGSGDLGGDSSGTINNKGQLAINPEASVITCENRFYNFGNISIANGQFTTDGFLQSTGHVFGVGGLSVLQEFEWTGGILEGSTKETPTTITAPTAKISGSTAKLLIQRQLNFVAPTPITVTHTGPFTMTKHASITIGQSTSFASSSSITSPDSTATFTNGGTLTGGLHLSGVTFYSSGTIGGDSSTSVFVNGSVTLTASSVISTIVTSPTQFTSLKTTGALTVGGSLNVKLDKNLVVDNSARIEIITYGSMLGNQSDLSIHLDGTTWINPNTCTGKQLTWVSSRNALELSFSGCKEAAPTPPPPTQTSQLQTFYIVAAVVIVIAVVIGFIAWCQKKYKKRPWDRLR